MFVRFLSKMNGRNSVEKAYYLIKEFWIYLKLSCSPYARRIQRFLALPYCYLFLVDWQTIPVGRIQVLRDFFYIYFVLKYFPDNYSPCRLWEKPRDQWVYYYGSNYDPYQRHRLGRYVQPSKYSVVYEDKWLCHELCAAKAIPVPPLLALIRPKDRLQDVLRDVSAAHPEIRRFVVKPVDGRGGAPGKDCCKERW